MTNTPPKPMLACKDWSEDKLTFPLYVQPKYDGVRALIMDGVVYGRSGKPIKNELVQKTFGHLHGFDGELVPVNEDNAPDCCRRVSGILNSPTDTSPCGYVVYDCWDVAGDFSERFALGVSRLSADRSRSGCAVAFAMTKLVSGTAELNDFETEQLEKGYEGVIIRSVEGKYKNGRSGKGDGGLLWALKRFEDAEATVIGFEERMHNANEATKDAFGRTERSSHKENMIPRGDLGALLVKSDKWTEEFSIGSGFDDAQRKEIWENKERYVGKLVKFQFFAHGGKERPRFPTFLSWRIEADV